MLGQFKPFREYAINALHELQNRHPQHYLSEEIMELASAHFNMSKGQLYGIATYYSMFRIAPTGTYLIRLCKSPVCQMMGSTKLVDYLKSRWLLKPDHTSDDGIFTLELCECLGQCGKAPSMMINGKVYNDLDPVKIEEILSNLKNTKR